MIKRRSHHGVCLEIIVYAIAVEVVSNGQAVVEIAFLLHFEGYLIVGDLIQLKAGHIVFWGV